MIDWALALWVFGPLLLWVPILLLYCIFRGRLAPWLFSIADRLDARRAERRRRRALMRMPARWVLPDVDQSEKGGRDHG